MQSLVIDTPRLRLVLESTEAVLRRIEELSPEDRQHVSPDWLEQLRASEPSPWTHGFSIVARDSQAAMGSCAFTGPPGPDGDAEIAYVVDEKFRGNGYAKEAATALIEFGKRAGLKVLRAHTLAEPGPSTTILAACGFQRVGDVIDSEDGPIWRWELQA
jgi:RimJ/RimL family protein N-acetyltransferase